MKERETDAKKGVKWHSWNTEQLLPQLPDEITLDQIAPRLSWRDFHFLASVSRRWRSAIASRQVYDARGFAKAIQTLVLFSSYADDGNLAISVYSLSDRQCFELPPVPKVTRHILRSARQWVALDGRVYVLGREPHCDEDKVYVLDVAGQQKQWKLCASMKQSRQVPQCVAFNGKIYVFGGSNGAAGSDCGSEVYDPREDAWSPIRQHGALVKGFYYVLPLGEELYVHCGPAQLPTSRKSLLVYHPIRDEWREEAKAFGHSPIFAMAFGYPAILAVEFVADGKLHSLCDSAVYVYDIENCLWVDLHSFSFSEVEPANAGLICVVEAVVALDDELLTVVRWFNFISCESTYYILHSRGFRGHCKEIFWEILHTCSSRPCDLKTIQV